MKTLSNENINLIVACGNNGQIGKDNKLLWHIPEDFKHFKEKTTNSVIIMGRNTYESLPGMLPNRIHIVITSKELKQKENLYAINSIEEAIKKAKEFNKEIWVIGGAQIYNEFIKRDLINKIYLSSINYSGEADAYFDLRFLSSGRYTIKSAEYFEKKNNTPEWSLKIYERI
jgi:dihydrofolate reductase